MPTELPDWLTQVRRSEIIEPVQQDTRTGAGKMLGIDRETAVRDVVGGGQADFDTPWGDLSADDRVLLYAYYNQPGHLEELTEAFRKIFHCSRPDEELIVVDLGCGPFTGGLAVAGVLGPGSRFDYIGVDRSLTMRRFGEHLASAAERFDEMPKTVRHWSPRISEVHWAPAPSWRPVFVIVSYLLASPTLDVETLVTELEGLLERLGRGPVTVLYTNSPRAGANRSFSLFCEALKNADFTLYADDTGTIEIMRWEGLRSRNLRYALFHRTEQGVLSL